MFAVLRIRKLFHDFSTQPLHNILTAGKTFFSPRCTDSVLWEGLDVVTRQWRHINNEVTRLNPACCCCRNRLLAGTQRAPLLSCRSVCLSWNRSRSPWNNVQQQATVTFHWLLLLVQWRTLSKSTEKHVEVFQILCDHLQICKKKKKIMKASIHQSCSL